MRFVRSRGGAGVLSALLATLTFYLAFSSPVYAEESCQDALVEEVSNFHFTRPTGSAIKQQIFRLGKALIPFHPRNLKMLFYPAVALGESALLGRKLIKAKKGRELWKVPFFVSARDASLVLGFFVISALTSPDIPKAPSDAQMHFFSGTTYDYDGPSRWNPTPRFEFRDVYFDFLTADFESKLGEKPYLFINFAGLRDPARGVYHNRWETFFRDIPGTEYVSAQTLDELEEKLEKYRDEGIVFHGIDFGGHGSTDWLTVGESELSSDDFDDRVPLSGLAEEGGKIRGFSCSLGNGEEGLKLRIAIGKYFGASRGNFYTSDIDIDLFRGLDYRIEREKLANVGKSEFNLRGALRGLVRFNSAIDPTWARESAIHLAYESIYNEDLRALKQLLFGIGISRDDIWEASWSVRRIELQREEDNEYYDQVREFWTRYGDARDAASVLVLPAYD